MFSQWTDCQDNFKTCYIGREPRRIISWTTISTVVSHLVCLVAFLTVKACGWYYRVTNIRKIVVCCKTTKMKCFYYGIIKKECSRKYLNDKDDVLLLAAWSKYMPNGWQSHFIFAVLIHMAAYGYICVPFAL